MASTITAATLTVKLTETVSLNGKDQGATNTMTIASIAEVHKRIVTVPQSEVTIANFGTAVAAGTFDEAKVRYIRLTNKDDANHLYIVFKNEYNNECCMKLDKGQSFIYNADQASGVIDTMLANQVALGFTEATGDTGDDDDIENITATNKIIPGLRYAHDATTVPAGTSVGAITGGDSTDGYRATAHTLVTRNASTGAESVSNTSGGADTDGTSTYSAGFGDLVEITAEADTADVDLEVFIASV
tara:strand:- start:1359 stop:2093 length:735 start_codon:yes stop_codon:yes gene_type:complete